MSQVTATQVKELRDKTGAGIMDSKNALVKANGNINKAIDILQESGIAKAVKKSGRVAAQGMTNIAQKDNNATIVELNSETDFVSSNKQFLDLLYSLTNKILKFQPSDLEGALKLKTENGTLKSRIMQLSARTGEKIRLRRFKNVTKQNDEFFGTYSHTGGQISVISVIKGGNKTVAKDIAMHVAAMNPEYISRQDIPKEVIDHQNDVELKAKDMKNKPDNIKEKIVKGRINKFINQITLLNQPFVKDDNISVGDYLKNNSASVTTFIRYQVGEEIRKQTDKEV